MERPSWRSQEVFVVPRRSGTRRRTDWIRVEKFSQGFRHYLFFAKPKNDLETKNIKPEDFRDRSIFMSMVNDIVWKKTDENCISNAEEVQELRHEVLAGTLDVSGPRIGGKVVWRSPRSKWTVELHRQQNGTAIRRDWSSCPQKHLCFESWNLEAKANQMYYSLQWRFKKYRTLVPNSSLCQSAQCLRSSCELVLSIRLERGVKRTSRCSCGREKFDHGGAERSGIVGISSDPGAWKQDARRRIELPNFGKEDTAYTALWKIFFQCDCQELLQKSIECRRRVGNSHSSVSRIFEFSILSENQTIVSNSRRHRHWTSFGSSRCKKSWQIWHRSCNSINCKPRIHNLPCFSREKNVLSIIKFMIADESSGPAMKCWQTVTNQEEMKKEK